MEHELRFSLTHADYVEAFTAAFTVADYGRRAVRAHRLIFTCLLGLAAVIAWLVFSAPGLAITYVVLGLVGFAASPRLATFFFRRRVAALAAKDGLGTEGNYTVTATETGLSWDWDGGSGVIKWPRFTSVFQSDHLYVLGMVGIDIMPIPKTVASGDPVAFIAELRTRAGIAG